MTAMMLDEIEPSDLDLIGQAQKGDRAAFGRLVERHYDFVYRVAWRWCGRKADAEDIAQEVCARLGTRDPHLSRRRRLHHMALRPDAERRARPDAQDAPGKRRRPKPSAFMRWSTGEGAPEPDDQAETLWAAVRKLPDKQRDAVLLVYGEGLSHAAAADAMACAEATVSWHIHEAKKRLKVLMRSAGED